MARMLQAIFIGLICVVSFVNSNSLPSDVKVRLTNFTDYKRKTYTHAGTVEVFYNGTWGAICDDDFKKPNAEVICRMLGKNTKFATPLRRSAMGKSKGPIWVDNLSCRGNETTIADCRHQPPGDYDCDEEREAAVYCPDERPWKVRLNPNATGGLKVKTYGGVVTSGAVEVKIEDEEWGLLCYFLWHAEAAVICNMLGFFGSKAVMYYSNFSEYKENQRRFGINETVRLDYFYCDPTNPVPNIRYCVNSWTLYGPNHTINCEDDYEITAVYCPPYWNFTRARLVDDISNTTNQGRVEINVGEGEWRPVCESKFGANEATVICRMMGINTTRALFTSKAYFGNSAKKMLLDNAMCDGTEKSILDCSEGEIIIGDLSDWCWKNNMHAGVVCLDSTDGERLRLVSGTGTDEGVLELSINSGPWGTFHGGFDNDGPKVACKLMGKPYENAEKQSASMYSTVEDRKDQPVLVKSIRCLGIKNSLFDCHYKISADLRNISHEADVALKCV